MAYCSPKNIKSDITCFSKKNLINLVKKYNTNNKKNKFIIKNKTKNEIWKELRIKLSTDCKNEWCWINKIETDSNKQKELYDNFRPTMPEDWLKNKYTWLSSTDINDVMKQYEKKHTNFLFIGPVPVDCPNGYLCELSNINLDHLLKSKKNILSIIFNLDKHYDSGSHWVALYINMLKNNISTIEYFDSYGSKPHKLIKQFMNTITDKLRPRVPCHRAGYHIYRQDFATKPHQYSRCRRVF